MGIISKIASAILAFFTFIFSLFGGNFGGGEDTVIPNPPLVSQRTTFAGIMKDNGAFTLRSTLVVYDGDKQLIYPVTIASLGEKISIIATVMQENGSSTDIMYIYNGRDSYVSIPSFKAYYQPKDFSLQSSLPILTESVLKALKPDSDADAVDNIDGIELNGCEYINGEKTTKYLYDNYGNIRIIEFSDTAAKKTVTLRNVSMVAGAHSDLFEVPRDYVSVDDFSPTATDVFGLGRTDYTAYEGGFYKYYSLILD